MLVLGRRSGESIVLPDFEVVVTVLEVAGSQVRLGISAPRTIGVYRDEVWQCMCRRRELACRLEC